jgi:hypothetical protein
VARAHEELTAAVHYWSSLAVRAQESGIVEGERTAGPALREGPVRRRAAAARLIRWYRGLVRAHLVIPRHYVTPLRGHAAQAAFRHGVPSCGS